MIIYKSFRVIFIIFLFNKSMFFYYGLFRIDCKNLIFRFFVLLFEDFKKLRYNTVK